MRKFLAFICLLTLMGASAFAQEFGSIKVTVKDAGGTPLPGVSATLTGNKIAPMSTVSSVGGSVRFLQLPVGSDYALRLELQGFRTYVREKLTVSFGRDVIFEVVLEQATIEEQVTVVGQSPVIDARRTQVGVNITSETLMSLPTARNPWVLMTLMPGMLVDREDVGGNEGGQQSSYYGHGGGRGDSTWSIDGGNITDNSALGAAPAYVNIASYDEMQINYGNNDVRSQTGGVQLNLVAKRGGNSYAGTFYMDVEDQAWQADNVPQALKDVGYTAAGIDRVYLYGANFGGPFVKKRLGSTAPGAIQDIDARHPDRDDGQDLARLRLRPSGLPDHADDPVQRLLRVRQQEKVGPDELGLRGAVARHRLEPDRTGRHLQGRARPDLSATSTSTSRAYTPTAALSWFPPWAGRPATRRPLFDRDSLPLPLRLR